MRGQINIGRDVKIASDTDKISINMRDADIRDVLNMLAKQGNFNIILDESVTGTLTVDINNISINKALEYIFTVTDLSYTKDGNTLIVASKEQAATKNLNARTFKAIPVLYKDANLIAQQCADAGISAGAVYVYAGSGVVPTVRLTEVFRQAAQSRIITNAHRINAGRLPDFKPPADLQRDHGGVAKPLPETDDLGGRADRRLDSAQ